MRRCFTLKGIDGPAPYRGDGFYFWDVEEDRLDFDRIGLEVPATAPPLDPPQVRSEIFGGKCGRRVCGP